MRDRQRRTVYRERMAGLLIGIIWTFVIVGGLLSLGALVQMAKAPYRKH